MKTYKDVYFNLDGYWRFLDIFSDVSFGGKALLVYSNKIDDNRALLTKGNSQNNEHYFVFVASELLECLQEKR